MAKQREKPSQMRFYDTRSRQQMTLVEYAERLHREAVTRRFWAGVGVALTVAALLAVVAVRVLHG